jgi:hypothetical protein
MGDGYANDLPFAVAMGERRFGILHAQVDKLADKVQGAIAQQGAWQQTRFREDLKTVANADDQTAPFGEFRNGIKTAQVAPFVPDKFGVATQHAGDDMVAIAVAVAAREDDDAKPHRRCLLRRVIGHCAIGHFSVVQHFGV